MGCDEVVAVNGEHRYHSRVIFRLRFGHDGASIGGQSVRFCDPNAVFNRFPFAHEGRELLENSLAVTPILRLRLSRAGDSLVAELPDSEINFLLPPAILARRPGLAGHVGREVIAGIRPEAFRSVQDHQESEDPMLTVESLVTESLGPDSYVFFGLDGLERNADSISVRR